MLTRPRYRLLATDITARVWCGCAIAMRIIGEKGGGEIERASRREKEGRREKKKIEKEIEKESKQINKNI